MVISLIGYMGSGKSHISKILSDKINFRLIDLDKEISRRNKLTIPEIFEKREKFTLESWKERHWKKYLLRKKIRF